MRTRVWLQSFGRTAGVLCLPLLLWALTAAQASEAGGAQVAPDAVLSLLLGPEDLPWEMVLDHVRSGAQVTRRRFEALAGGSAMSESWSGPVAAEQWCLRAGKAVCEEAGHCTCLKGPAYSVSLSFAVASSPEEAAKAALKEVQSAAEVSPEVTGGQSVASFADRAWYGDNARGYANGVPTAGNLVFVRNNVAVAVAMGDGDGFDPQLLIGLAARLSRKIDAAAAGRPEEPPLLPSSAEEMHLDLEGAWAAYESGKLLTPEGGTRLALKRGGGLLRAVPARQVAKHEFMVPLSQLAGLIGATERVKVQGKQASVKLASGTVTVTQGKAQAKYGTRSVTLSRPVEFRRGQVLVPLSIAEKVLGQKISWEKRGALMVARL